MTDQLEDPKKGGRPSKDPVGGKRPTVTFRCRAALQRQLQEAAFSSDKSVSEEIEGRLSMSFEPNYRFENAKKDHQALIDLIGGQDKIFFALLMGVTLKEAIKYADSELPDEQEWTSSEKKQSIIAKSLAETIPEIIKNATANKGELAKGFGRVHSVKP